MVIHNILRLLSGNLNTRKETIDNKTADASKQDLFASNEDRMIILECCTSEIGAHALMMMSPKNY